MSCRWPIAATTKTITSQQGLIQRVPATAPRNPVAWAIVMIRNSSATLIVALPGGASHLNAALLSDLDLTWTRSRLYVQVNSMDFYGFVNTSRLSRNYLRVEALFRIADNTSNGLQPAEYGLSKAGGREDALMPGSQVC
jgi:hypothetical protein